MTDDHKVVNRRRSVNSMHMLYSLYTTCIHVVQRSAVLADTDGRLIVKTQPVSVRIFMTFCFMIFVLLYILLCNHSYYGIF